MTVTGLLRKGVLASLFVIKNAILLLADLGHPKAITVIVAAPAIMSNTQDELQSVYESLAYKQRVSIITFSSPKKPLALWLALHYCILSFVL